MSWDRVAGEWNNLVGEVKEKWSKLTDADLSAVAGRRERLVGKLRERYGMLETDAERAVDEWTAKRLMPEQDAAKAIRPPTQSLLDEERASGEGMGQAKYGPPSSSS